MNELERLPIPLLQWYRENARTLPWRSDPTPYHVWVSEIMLQQTRVAAVLEYYRRFMEALPTVEDLARVDGDRLMKLWQGLGYYNRARNLQKAARQVAEDHGGEFPRTREGLLTLSGVGEYTAGAVASIAFGVPVPAVDGNVLRVVSRLTGDGSDIGSPETKRRMGAALRAVLPVERPGDFNQAMMDLGAMVCLPNGAPLCEKCPAGDFCRARREERTGELPVKAAKKARRVEERRVFLLFHGGRVALRRRGPKGLLAGLWEYPNELAGAEAPPPVLSAGAPAEGAPAESRAKQGTSELLEQWGVEPVSLEDAGTGKHIFTHIEWKMRGICVEAASDRLPAGWVWAGREELDAVYAVPNAFRSFQHVVEERVKGTDCGSD